MSAKQATMALLLCLTLVLGDSAVTHAQVKAKVKDATAGNPGSVALSCTPGVAGPGQGGDATFNFYRATTNATTVASCPAAISAYTILGVSPMAASCAYTDATVAPNTNYCYVATALDIALGTTCPANTTCESAPTAPAIAIVPPPLPPPPPLNLVVGAIVAIKVPLWWSAPTPATGVTVVSYNVYDCVQSGCGSPAEIAGGVSGTYYLAHCKHTNHKCFYQIRANDLVDGQPVLSAPSNTVRAQVY
jgi:hypothetical protein